MTPSHYRLALRTDAARIIDFQIAMALETEDVTLDPATCESGVLAALDDSSRGSYFVGLLGDQVIASALITYEWSDWRNGAIWWLQSVYVIPEARRRGVFRGLFEFIRQLAMVSPDVRGLRLYVDRRNLAAQQVYRQLGMDGDHYQVFEWMKGP